MGGRIFQIALDSQVRVYITVTLRVDTFPVRIGSHPIFLDTAYAWSQTLS